jgi:glyoxylase-like metal-dependent hydrolase (beta-lactamase superfamily II)
MKRFIGSCNSYLYKNILIDVANGIDYMKEDICPEIAIITHEHCDHFSGLMNLDCKEIISSVFTREVINEKKDEFGMCKYFSVDYPNRKIDRSLVQGEIIEGDGFALKVIVTPGHAKGAICLYDSEAKILFAGDTVFPDYSMPRVDLPSSEPEKLKLSYEKLVSLDIEEIYPGHGEVIKEKNYIKKIIKNLD